MMDYSKLSDKEINKQVSFALGCKEVMPDIFMDDNRRYEFDKPKKRSGNQFYFDPCNNPADAWPIITSSRIGIVPGTATDKWAAHHGDWDIAIADVNPLRAAMIIFLMMQDSRK
ncbi:TPA: phage protein NinX family protein [Klebsiella pneumoniae]|uniref:phage protein NinX family protein n=1 Tax=Klebsiella pneumoniae TaxID=573 RepID=UPI0039899366